MFTEQLPLLPDMPNGAQEAYTGMSLDQAGDHCDFTDYLARPVAIPRKGKPGHRTPIVTVEHARILWDLRCGNLMLGDDGETLYRRDVDWTGRNRPLDTWHECPDLNTEYNVPPALRLQVWDKLAKVTLAERAERVRHGIRFTDRAYRRNPATGRIDIIRPNDPMFHDAWECTTGVPYDAARAREGVEWCRWLTDGEHSAQNLARMLATPSLEPYKHLTYVLYGRGGNGKGLLLNALNRTWPKLTAVVDASRLLGGPRGGTGSFATEQEAVKLRFARWAYDEDADEITPAQMTVLKKVSTGDLMTARQIRRDSFSFHPKCTLIVATNNPVVTALGESSDRRLAYIRMRDGRTPDEFAGFIGFLDADGIRSLLMSSCSLWTMRGDDPWRDVSIGDVQDLSEAEQWIVDEIDDHGWAVSQDNPFRESPGDHRRTVAKLGLRTTRKRVDGRLSRVLVVGDERRYNAYHAHDAQATGATDRFEPADPIAPMPMPIDDAPAPGELKRLGYACAFVPANTNKVAVNWQKTARQGGIVDPAALPAYGVVPMDGCCVIDMDVPANGDDGWTVLQREVGAYGTAALPATWLVRTQSGGVHAYYRVPPELRGRLKNRVHPGVPVDIRAEGKGYVLGAGSHGEKGDYRLIDLPGGERIPMLSAQLCEWLIAHDCVTGMDGMKPLPLPALPTTAATPSHAVPTLAQLMDDAAGDGRRGRVDMSPVSEGQRNDTLHAWCFGRLANHPGEALRIRQDLFQRGCASGLRDGELTQIWNSCVRELDRRGRL